MGVCSSNTKEGDIPNIALAGLTFSISGDMSFDPNTSAYLCKVKCNASAEVCKKVLPAGFMSRIKGVIRCRQTGKWFLYLGFQSVVDVKKSLYQKAPNKVLACMRECVTHERGCYTRLPQVHLSENDLVVMLSKDSNLYQIKKGKHLHFNYTEMHS
jgi:hypothetical protein